MTPLQLPSVRFRREREQVWRELEQALAGLEKGGLRALTPAQLGRLPVLYRSALSSASVARAIALDASLRDYLDGLAARAHMALYCGREPFLPAARRFWAATFPRAVRALWRQLLAAALLVALGAGVAWRECARDPERFHDFVEPAYAQGRGPEATDRELREVLEQREAPKAALVRFGSFLFTHNASIGLRSLGLGFAGGLPVFYLMLENGFTLGAFGWLHRSRGLSAEFWGWVLPHGVTEILALLVCAAGGLLLGQSLVFPGRRGRLQSLARAGSEAGVLAVGAVAMFLLAGAVEGVFRQTVADASIRWTVAGASAVSWLAYFALAGRRR